MTLDSNLIDELEQAMSNGDIGRRAKALRLVSDLFALGSGRFSEGHIKLFDQIMLSIVGRVEISARATFSQRLSSFPDAPCGTIRLLAFDEAIEVARPVLSLSGRLVQEDIVSNARKMSQVHLLAIAERAELPREVTDVLLERGDRAVAECAARNAKASFSDFGYASLAERSRDDVDLALSVWARPELPRLILVKLFVDASKAVQKQLEANDAHKTSIVRELVARASTQLLKQTRTESPVYLDASMDVMALHKAGELTQARLADFAERGDFYRTTTAISLLCDLPIELVEQILVRSNTEQLIILAKATDLTWPTTKAILVLGAQSDRTEAGAIERAFVTFTRLQLKTAMAALQFYRMRERAKPLSGAA